MTMNATLHAPCIFRLGHCQSEISQPAKTAGFEMTMSATLRALYPQTWALPNRASRV